MKITFFKLRPKDHPFPLFSWLIMMFQSMNPFKKDSWSHMAIGFESETGAEKIADVPFWGFREMREDRYFKKYHIVGSKSRKFDISRKEFLSWLENHEGKHYDFLQVIGLALKMVKLRKNNYAGKDLESLICNELIISFLIRFDKLKVKDSDNWDLLMTWEKV